MSQNKWVQFITNHPTCKIEGNNKQEKAEQRDPASEKNREIEVENKTSINDA